MSAKDTIADDVTKIASSGLHLEAISADLDEFCAALRKVGMDSVASVVQTHANRILGVAEGLKLVHGRIVTYVIKQS